MKDRKNTTTKLTPSQLVKKQLTGNGFFDQTLQKPRIIEFLNLADYSINTQSYVNIDQPLFEAVPPIIQFSDYQPLQIKEKVFKLRNKDRFSRRVKIIQPDSKLFQVLLPNDNKKDKPQNGTKVAAGMETKFVIRFSPEAKIDYKYELIVVTERQKFIVPILAIGKRAMLDFPDVLDFGSCPVKFNTEKPVIIRNLGQKTTKWTLDLPHGFTTNMKEGVLQPGKNQQILLKFYPIEARLYRASAKLQYDKLNAFVELLGSGQLSNVYLSKPIISMEQSYIGLQSQQTLHIINKSNVKVSFQWRAFASEKEEKPKKQLFFQQLQEQQAQQLMLLREFINSGQNQKEYEQENLNDSSSQEQTDPRQLLDRKRKRAELALARKYKTIRKAIEDDLFLFQDNIFKIQPLVGEIWPNSQITITVTFMPIQANTYDCMAYCNISCAEERLPLKLKGQGLGPKAYLTQQEINFGDIFVNQPIKQTIQIENRGEIPCHFTLQKPERAFAKMFNFSIDQKTLEVGENCSVDIRFKSSIPGQFKQKFRWQLHGSQRNLEMTFLGHVIAPTFEFVDPNDTLKAKPQINFGKVSYDFQYKQGIILKNTSSVEFTYNLKIQSDTKIGNNQFIIIPQSGTIPQKSEKLIEIQFTPKSVKKYQTVMTIDIQGVGNDMLSVPIKADCQVPSVDIFPNQKVQFPEACLNYPQAKTIVLKNHSDIKAKFNIIPQSEESKVLAKYSVYPQHGVIDERDSKQLQITLTTCKLGQITLPLHINIVGTNNNQPSLLNICANSDGPKVVVTPQELDFEQVEVLKDYTLKVTIVNNSKIKAQFHAFTRQKVSIFKPKVKHAFLEPGQRMDIDVICNADDASKFNDILHFVVKDGKDKDVVLKAKGVGSTIYCQDNLEALDFGTVFTYKTVVKEIFIQNRGRKSQKIIWQRKKPVEKKKPNKQKNQKDKQPLKQIQQQPVFVIDPQNQTIPPKYGRYFRFIAMSQKKGKISQQFTLTSQIGNQRNKEPLKTMTIQGQFIQPNLIYSQKKMNFRYFWQKDVIATPLQKILEITSGCALPLTFTLKVALPFTVSEENVQLQPGSTSKIKVSFDPNFKVDKLSGNLNGKINIVFNQHPHRQVVELLGQLCFPNLKLEANLINFGAILNDTTKKINMLMKNVSQMPVTYEWAFLQEQVVGQQEKMNISSASLFPNSTPINQIFDILPLSGKLGPNQVQQVQFIYNAQGGNLFRATALCHVQGGPNYQVKLEGDSSLIGGKISQKELDFGSQRFCEWQSKDIFIENTGKVTFQFKVNTQYVKNKPFLQVIPMNGKIAGGQKQKITIRICPTMPCQFEQKIEIQMGYYDPQIITIKGIGVYPSLLCQFPRVQNPDFDVKCKQQMDRYIKQYEAFSKKSSKDRLRKKDSKQNIREIMKPAQQHKIQIQKELDRNIYCNMIKKAMQTYVKPQIKEKEAGNNKLANYQTKLFQKLFLSSWICDFGNVIVGSTQKKTLKFKNAGDYLIQIVFDTKIIKGTQYNITPDKLKLNPGQQISVNVTLTTKKNSKFGKLKASVTLDVKNGAKHKLELISNLTIPQITVDGWNEGVVDFGKVLCGQRKTITLRFLNLKQISCDWSLNLRQPLGPEKDNDIKYELQPSSGKIQSGSFQIVKLSFTPSSQKDFLTKFPIKIQDNPKVLVLDLKGIGTGISLQVKPIKLKVGPVLPYNHSAFAMIQISNPTQYFTQLVSLDFDKKFKEDIETLNAYQQMKNAGKQIKKDKDKIVFLPIRQAGAGVWSNVIKEVNEKKKIQELKKQIQTQENQQQKKKLQKQLENLTYVAPQTEYPRKVDSQNILHLIMYGPPESGKTHVANSIHSLHKRAVIKVSEIINWHINSNTDLSKSITEYLEERKKQLQSAQAEREKAFKKAGKKAKQLQQKLGPANEHMYEYLPQKIWIEAIKERIRHPQCNAGCVFDDLSSKHAQNQLILTNMILKAVGSEAVSLLQLDTQKIIKNQIQKKQDQQKSQRKRSQHSESMQKSSSKHNLKDIKQMNAELQDQVKFQIKQFSSQEEKNAYMQRKDKITKLIKNQLEEKIKVKIFRDPIFDDKKQQSQQGAQIRDVSAYLGAREILQIPIYCNSSSQYHAIKENVPPPFYRDPMKQPLPSPEFQQVVTRFTGKMFESKLLKQFEIYTPKEDKYCQYKKAEKKDQKKDRKGSTVRKDKTKIQIQQPEPQPLDVKIQTLSKQQTRWVIPGQTTLKLIVKFFSKVPGNFESSLTFDNTFNLKKTIVPINAKSDFPTLVNLPKALFWNLKKSRPTTSPQCYLTKCFVLNQNIFDFGPLLIGKNQEKKNQKVMLTTNSTTFKLVNNGHYPAQVQVALLSSIMQNDNSFKKGIFTLSSEQLAIGVDEPPKQLRVWSVPDQPKLFNDQIIIMIKNNPVPITIPIKCLGQKPSVQIIEGSPIKFTRILLNQNIKRQLKLKNRTAIPIKFKLEGCEALPEEFNVSIKQGKLKPNQETSIEVTFKALKQKKFSQSLKLIAQDVQNLQMFSEPIQIPIQAEAFDISVELKFPNENTENLLDFGAIRVGDFKDQTFNIKNIGLYNVKISFNMKTKKYKDVFKIEPSQVQLQPNISKQILVRFSSLKQLKLKTNNNNSDINMEVLQGKTLQTHRTVPINVNVNAVFSNYSVVPLRNMNFGPIQFNQNKTRTFEIKNQGLFDFNFSIFDYNNADFRKQMLENIQKDRQAKLQAANNMPSVGGAVDPKKAGGKKQVKDVKKEAKKGKGGKVDQNALKIDQWSINPSTGTVAPDSSMTIQVTFSGKGQKLFEQKIGIDIQNRNPDDEPNGILYQLIAQSCIPGINTENFQSIFEEQLVMPSQHHSSNVSSIVKSNVFYAQERIFSFGTLVPSKIPEGIIEKLRIQNSNKIPCTVKFDVRKKNPNAVEQFAFQVSPKELKIPAHQHQYINLTFKPAIMASYAGIFQAIVDNGDQQPKTHKMTFDLKGQGALPTLRVQKPKQYLDERTILLKFPRTRIGKSSIQQISMKNDGNIPATVKFELTHNDNFKFLDSNSTSLTPKSYSTFNIQFKPSQVGVKQWDITAQTLLNQYEQYKFKIQGEAYFEDYLFQNLPEQLQDKINFDDIAIGQQKRINFMLKNNSGQVIKFNWAYNEDFKFLPKIGHINAKSGKTITMIFKAKNTITHKQTPVACQICQIKQSGQQYNDWDDSMIVRKFVTEKQYQWIQNKKEQQIKKRQQQAQAAKKGGKKDVKKAPKKQQPKEEQKMPAAQPGQQANVPIQQIIPQTQNAVLQKTQKTLNIKASGVADYAKYQIQDKIIDFLPTMMYTSRVHKFTLKNTSTIKMQYNCKIVNCQTGKIDPGFFSISPHNGNILPNCDQTFTVKFSPTQVQEFNDRLLSISIKNLSLQAQKLIIQLNGDIQRPICHFELAPSKYREKKPDIEAKYNIIEFQSLGTKVKNTKRFYVINPTSLAYDYEWKKIEDPRDNNAGFFRCVHQKGTILSGKKAEMIFEYTPDLVGSNHESYWIFQIPSQKIIQYFLVVGNVIEPNVFFDIGKVNFGPLLLGGKNKETVCLKNLEQVPLPFNFEKSSIKGQIDYGNSLIIQPMNGVIPPQGQTKIQILFQPKVSKQFNYNVVCNIGRKSRPICINVKGIGYVLLHSVYLNNKANALNKGEKTEVSFGNIFVNEKKSRNLLIENNGDFNFDFAIKTSHDFPFLHISHQFGTVRKNQKFSIDLQFTPQDQFAFKSNASLTLSIISGPNYVFILRGTAKKPGVEFSFYTYDFGPCFVLKQPLPITAQLQIRNRQQTAMTIESLYEKTPHLDVKIPSGQVVLPVQMQTIKNKKGGTQRVENNVVKIPIVFTPRDLMKYNQTLTFDINQLNKIYVKIKGQGIPMKLQLEKTEDQNIDFGIAKVGLQTIRTVSLVNHSKKKLEITLDVDNQLEQLKKLFINIHPSGNLIINPRQKQDIEIIFKPDIRISPFKTQLQYKIVQNQQIKKLLNIFGTAHGIQMRLMQDTVGFGTVVVNSKITKTVQLSNFGDIGAKFEWDSTFCGKYFTILPSKGYLVPHQDLMFDITFHPNVADNDIRFKVKCNIEGMDPLFINLVGKCIAQPNQAIQQLKFESMVRKKITQKVTIKNPTAKQWKIKASISSDDKFNYFEGKEFIEVGPNSSADYQISYNPLTMTSNADAPEIKQQSHTASLFFPVPDGTALMYKLVGKATPPVALQSYDLNTKAKTNLVHLIPIKNWLKNSQRFNVTWKFDVEQKSVFINAATIFDIAGDSTKQYKLSIYALKGCQVKFTLFFTNPKSNEFISFKINLNVTPSDPMKTIQMNSLVRETNHKLVTIENPLPNSVQIKKEMISIESDVLFLSPNSFTIPAKSQFGVDFIFRPLLAKQENTKVTIKSPQLGEFVYPLKLVGNPSTSQRTMNFKTALGSQITQKFKFIHYGKKPTTYTCRVQKVGQKSSAPIDPKAKVPVVSVDFTVQNPTLNAPGTDNFDGVQQTVNVRFEPSSMAQTSCQLIISSVDGGQYVGILNGYATSPQPKGPFKISAKPPPIDFKNPFFDAFQFVVRIDNPAFTSTVKSPVKIDGKKNLAINLAYKAVQGFPANGRLTISAGQNLSWVFYLQGE